MSLIDKLQKHVQKESELVNKAAVEGDEERREELLARADEESEAYMDTLNEMLAAEESGKRNNCLFCGMPVEIMNARMGLSGQHGEVACDACGAAYQLRVTIQSKPHDDTSDSTPVE